MADRIIGLNEKGRRVGEYHKDAKLSDHEVELMRRLHEDEGWGYRKLAKKFEIARSTAQKICNYRIRAQCAVRFRRYP